MSSLRSCSLRVELVHPDRRLLVIPDLGQEWRDRVRTELSGWLALYLEEAVQDLPVGVQVIVKPHGEPSITVVWDDPDTEGGEAPLPDDEAEMLPAATALAQLAQQALAAVYPRALRRAKSGADAAALGEDCPDCQAGVPLPARFLLPGDMVTEQETPEGPWYTVVEVDPKAGVLVLDIGDPDGLPVALAVDMNAVGWIKAPM